ncbi:MAG TPA: thioesterase family protein [Kiloniellales bacterium]|nr:thioesterase family protein [Kiloniellales bacterium]
MPGPLTLKDDRLYHFDGGKVLPAWIDWNGHMNVAYYVLAFDQAVDAQFDAMGLDSEERETTGCSMFAAEMHLLWKKELSEDEPIAITFQFLDFDEKRVHSILHMYHGSAGYLAATCELMQLSVDLNARRSVPWSPKVLSRLQNLYAPQQGLPRPAEVGRVMGVPVRAPAG